MIFSKDLAVKIWLDKDVYSLLKVGLDASLMQASNACGRGWFTCMNLVKCKILLFSGILNQQIVRCRGNRK